MKLSLSEMIADAERCVIEACFSFVNKKLDRNRMRMKL